MVDFKNKKKSVQGADTTVKNSLREKFSGTNLKHYKEETEEENKTLSRGSGNAGYHDIVDGSNKFRIAPPHDNKKKFYQIVMRSWISYDDDGEVKRGTVYNARQHGNGKRDIIEAYMDFVKKMLAKSKDPKKDEKIKKMYDGYKGGISPSTTFVCYAWSVDDKRELKFLEFKKSVRDQMDDIAYSEEEDSEIEIDPFTPADSGRPITIKYNSNAKKAADYYKTTISKHELPLDDSQLEELEQQKPLTEVFGNIYGIKDFEKALSGLEFYDEQEEINVFHSDEFQEIIEEYRNQFDDEVIEEEQEEGKSKKGVVEKKSSKKPPFKEEEEAEEVGEEEEEEVEEGDILDDMERSELKKFIVKNGLEVKVLTKDSDEEIREKIRAAAETSEEEEEVEEEEEEEEQQPKPLAKKKEEKKEPVAKTSKTSSSNERLEALKKNLAKFNS